MNNSEMREYIVSGKCYPEMPNVRKRGGHHLWAAFAPEGVESVYDYLHKSSAPTEGRIVLSGDGDENTTETHGEGEMWAIPEKKWSEYKRVDGTSLSDMKRGVFYEVESKPGPWLYGYIVPKGERGEDLEFTLPCPWDNSIEFNVKSGDLVVAQVGDDGKANPKDASPVRDPGKTYEGTGIENKPFRKGPKPKAFRISEGEYFVTGLGKVSRKEMPRLIDGVEKMMKDLKEMDKRTERRGFKDKGKGITRE